MRRNQRRFVWLGVSILGVLTLSPALLAQASPGAEADAGVPTDWTSHHVIFSTPGSAAQAERVQQDPRYWHQMYRQSPLRLPAAQAASTLEPGATVTGKKHQLNRDWSQDLGSGGTVGAGNYPAKFSFGSDNASCNDFVVYGTGLLGSATQANIVAYNNPTCNGTTIGTGTTVTQSNGTICAPFNFTNPVTDNVTFVQFSTICNFGTTDESVMIYADLPANCTGNPNYSNNGSVTLCQTFPTVYPNVSFMFTNAGGINGCAEFQAAIAALEKLLCISGDTVVPTRSGTVLAKNLQVGTEILTAEGDFKPVQMFWHRVPEEASCLRVCSKASQDCVTVSAEHYIRSSQGFETAETLPRAEFSVEAGTCDGLVSFYVEGGSFALKQGGMQISSFSKTWGLSHDALLWLTEWSGILMAPIRDWTFFAEASRCLSKGAIACAFGSLGKLA